MLENFRPLGRMLPPGTQQPACLPGEALWPDQAGQRPLQLGVNHGASVPCWSPPGAGGQGHVILGHDSDNDLCLSVLSVSLDRPGPAGRQGRPACHSREEAVRVEETLVNQKGDGKSAGTLREPSAKGARKPSKRQSVQAPSRSRRLHCLHRPPGTRGFRTRTQRLSTARGQCSSLPHLARPRFPSSSLPLPAAPPQPRDRRPDWELPCVDQEGWTAWNCLQRLLGRGLGVSGKARRQDLPSPSSLPPSAAQPRAPEKGGRLGAQTSPEPGQAREPRSSALSSPIHSHLLTPSPGGRAPTQQPRALPSRPSIPRKCLAHSTGERDITGDPCGRGRTETPSLGGGRAGEAACRGCPRGAELWPLSLRRIPATKPGEERRAGAAEEEREREPARERAGICIKAGVGH
ncbi:uncharacterized protein LOC134739278 [Pongo pygmaeus]|uniref:uncharacterized protein LOC134739278 n=1 Tax=Pongo pygmaeus TaxID=9600 RepID=UPI00300C52C6